MKSWIRSSFCAGGDCVEAVRVGAKVVLVQDSKRPAAVGGSMQAWSLGEWLGLLAAIRAAGREGQARHVALDFPEYGVEHMRFGLDRHELLNFDFEEWRAFRDGVLAGEFDPEKLSGPESPGRGGDEGRAAGSVSADRSGGVAAGTVSGGRSRGSAVPVAAELTSLDDELDLLNSPAGRDLSGNPREGFPDAVATTDRPGAEPPTPVAAPLLNSPAGRPVDASTGEVVLSLADRPGSDAAGTGVPPDLVPAAQLDDVLAEVAEERERQNQKWGEQNHADGTGGVTLRRWAEQDRAICQEAFRKGVGTWRHILTEEVSEALAEDDPAKLRAELVQVAAVAAQWVQAIDRREWARAVAPLVPTDGAP